ncbi:MAG TPA: malto-oligosyltrehalose trehalohydrolase [Opitutus sp.]|nr:malto-oligosyltrehalose trehalohydrolase [Opitutus sp.]
MATEEKPAATAEHGDAGSRRHHGAHVHDYGVTYRVWAPDHASTAVEIHLANGGRTTLPLARDRDGYFTGEDEAGRAGDRYGFRFADGSLLPDPASRFQPDGVHALSECVDPRAYAWRCETWRRPGWRGQAIYELHVGTFTPAGTFRGAIEKLDHVAALGVEAIELMPVADFAGERNWGYDGVALYAPARCYGRPDDLRAFVDAAHERGLAVILDVVYNHLGPDGNHLARFAGDYFRAERSTAWGQALNFSSGAVRDFFVENAIHWIDDFRIDGLRIDATHAIEDDSPRHILAEIAAAAHARGAFVIAEDERNLCELMRREDGSGWQLDAAWADDFHHQVRVALTGTRERFFGSFSGSAHDLAHTLEHGWFYMGQPFSFWQNRPRGEPCRHLPAASFVYCIENHDQTGNREHGERLEHLVSPAAFRAASMLLGLAPHPPLIFMGQEWAAGTPFLFFTNFGGELGATISRGRRREFGHAADASAPDPESEETFAASKLRWDEIGGEEHARTLELYRASLRQRTAWLRATVEQRTRWCVNATAVAVTIRYLPPRGERQRLVVAALWGAARVALRPDDAWQIELASGSVALEGSTLVCNEPATVLLVAADAGDRGGDSWR